MGKDDLRNAKYVIDIGPEAGERGGEVVIAGTPEEVARSRRSRTAPFLKEELRVKAPNEPATLVPLAS